MNILLRVALCAFFCSNCALKAADLPVRYNSPVEVGTLPKAELREPSGLAPSRRTGHLLWTHNDSGGKPVLYAISTTNAQVQGRLRLEGVPNDDWEDIASFEIDGKAWLMIGDMGDNNARRSRVALHIIQEPEPATLTAEGEVMAKPAYSIYFVYEDGPRDCESVAVDTRERTVYLLSKRDPVPHLYRLDLKPAAPQQPATARRAGSVTHLPKAEGLQKSLPIPTGAYRGAPTAMAFNQSHTAALVLTYGQLLLFPREANESWADALAKLPVRLPEHPLPQAEGACFSRDDRQLYLTSEGMPLLLRFDPE